MALFLGQLPTATVMLFRRCIKHTTDRKCQNKWIQEPSVKIKFYPLPLRPMIQFCFWTLKSQALASSKFIFYVRKLGGIFNLSFILQLLPDSLGFSLQQSTKKRVTKLEKVIGLDNYEHLGLLLQNREGRIKDRTQGIHQVSLSSTCTRGEIAAGAGALT